MDSSDVVKICEGQQEQFKLDDRNYADTDSDPEIDAPKARKGALPRRKGMVAARRFNSSCEDIFALQNKDEKLDFQNFWEIVKKLNPDTLKVLGCVLTDDVIGELSKLEAKAKADAEALAEAVAKAKVDAKAKTKAKAEGSQETKGKKRKLGNVELEKRIEEQGEMIQQMYATIQKLSNNMNPT
jgi:flagellar biosynthesis/type III secretory pathway protein FliH